MRTEQEDSLPSDIPAHVLECLSETMLRDRPRLGRDAVRLRALKKKTDKDRQAIDQLWLRFVKSRNIRLARSRQAPLIEFPPELTISEKIEEISAAIRDNQVVIIAGSTGSGKTTQLPKLCVKLGRGQEGLIGITQPRRIAAMSVAARVAKEINTSLGEMVGYQIRFQSRTKPETLVKFMTDGVLLNELRGDPELLQYDTVILDEAHERNLDTDLLLGCIRRILPARPNFRLIVSSATLDVERFSAYFDEAPVIKLEGRTYPVDVRYRPPADEDDDDPDLDVMILHAVEELTEELPHGDILVFLPGEGDIREAGDTLTRSGPRDCLITPLYSRLTPEERQKVFQTTEKRKIILATNVAETSLTIPSVRAVIDSGLARMKRVSDKASVERLQIEKISQASAEQRKGRAGRVAPGICVRLYSEKDYLKRPAYTDPEIRRASLASVILRLRYLGLGAVEDFPFLDPPQPSRVQEGYRELAELGALDEKRDITAPGRRMATLPVEPRFARILLQARKNGALDPALTIVAMLSIQDPRERPQLKKGEAEAAHKRFLHPKSDFLGWLELYKFFDDALATLPSKSQARKFCRQNFLNYLRMMEWRDIRRQAAEIMESIPDPREKVLPGTVHSDKDGGYARLHTAILSGLLGRMGKRTEDNDYQGARGVRFLLWPGSGLARAARERREASREAGDLPSEIKRKGQLPAWVVAAELAETSRLFGRGVAEIDPLWAEELAGPLAKRSYSEPYYDVRTGFVRAREKVEVYGLPVVENRRVHYAAINPVAAREIFIRQALVEENLAAKLPFYKENVALTHSVAEIAHKARQPIMASSDAIYRFYDERLPADVHNDRALAKFSYEEEKAHSGCLLLTRQYLLEHPPDGITPDRFPSTINLGGRTYPLSYRFHPGHEEDGVTVTVPVADIPNLPVWRMDWLVPGLLGLKVADLLRGLPKSARRDLTPIPETAEEITSRLGAPDRPLTEAVAEAAYKITGRKIPGDAWNLADLPAFLHMNVRAVDVNGRTVGQGRDVAKLAESLKLAARAAFDTMDKDYFEKTGLDAWTFGDLPERMEIRSGSGAAAFPALVDEGKTVGIRLFHTKAEADHAMPGGYRRMLHLTLGAWLAKLRKDVRLRISARAAALSQTLGGGGDSLADECISSALDEVFDTANPPRTHRVFLERIAGGKENLYPAAMEVRAALEDAHSLAATLVPGLEHPPTPAHADAYRDMLHQLESLLSPAVLRLATAEQLRQLPRFVQAAQKRLERLKYALGKDKMRLAELLPYRERYETAAKSKLTPDEARLLIDYRWTMEEWRIGLFAQEAGQKILGSGQKLDALWRKFTAK